jgi:aryl-alcohol dehydrogenase-like predicted oxidoreductase
LVNIIFLSLIILCSAIGIFDAWRLQTHLRNKVILTLVLVVPLFGPVFYMLLRSTFGPTNDPWFNHVRGRGEYWQEDSMKLLMKMQKQNIDGKNKRNNMLIGLGTANFGTSIDSAKAHALMDVFLQSGGTIIDTANNYAFWHGNGSESETCIGKWLKKHPRESVEIHTKIGAMPTDGKSFDSVDGLSRKAIIAAINTSLLRLDTDFFDVVYTHLDDQKTDLFETFSTLSEYVEAGIIKNLGISNYSIERVLELAQVIKQYKLSPISYAQYRHSIIEPKPCADFGIQICLTPTLKDALVMSFPNIQMVAYSPLLDGAFEPAGALPEQYTCEKNQQLVEALREEAQSKNVEPSALVLKKIANEGILPLTMTSKIGRLVSNLSMF